MKSVLIAGSLARSTSDLLNSLDHVVTGLSVVDWILVGLAALLTMWGWVRAAAFARLGTIKITDVGADGSTLTPIAVRAELQKGLGDRGLLPASGVPSGSPTKADLSSAVASSPAPQAGWLAALINVIPVPPTSISFELSATMVTNENDATEKVGLDYQLVCAGPRQSVTLDRARGAEWSAVIDTTVKDVYRQIAEDAPAIYPRWSRWKSSAALTQFTNGLTAEAPTASSPPQDATMTPSERLSTAIAYYRQASESDPDNMLARLRSANCLERQARELDGLPQMIKLMDALEAYVSIRLREPGIFEAGYRASVLLSNVAQESPAGANPLQERLIDILDRLERAGTDIPAALPVLALRRLRLGVEGLRSFLRPRILELDTDPTLARAKRAALRESRLARRRLRAPYPILVEGRFRHRFEPTGRERRALLKALRVSKLCINARRAASQSTWNVYPAQLVWRARLSVALALPPYEADWQAEYNASCFYALLLEAWNSPKRGRRVRTKRITRLAFRHLGHAIEKAGHELQCRYVRDEDPDLNALRDPRDDDRVVALQIRNSFRNVLAPLCPSEVLVHLSRALSENKWSTDAWTLHAWGGAQETTWENPLLPVNQSPGELTFRVRLLDENQAVVLILHMGAEKALPENRIISVLPRATDAWLYLDDTVARKEKPGGWPARTGGN